MAKTDSVDLVTLSIEQLTQLEALMRAITRAESLFDAQTLAAASQNLCQDWLHMAERELSHYSEQFPGMPSVQ